MKHEDWGMEIKPLTVPTRCENGACGAMADYTLVRPDTPVRMHLHLCRPCLQAIVGLGQQALGQTQSPAKAKRIQ